MASNDDTRQFTLHGSADFHDGTLRSVARSGDHVRVEVLGASGRRYGVDFTGVVDVDDIRPEGMLLYSLIERQDTGNGRRFVFVNWEEADEEGGDARLEITAADIRITQMDGSC